MHNLRLLLVEDDDDIRVALAELLEDEGFQVACAVHGGEALALLSKGARPDVILLDLVMPTMDARAFRAKQLEDLSLASIPVLLLTAASTDEAQGLGELGRIPKPIDLDLLFTEIRKLTSKG